MRRLMIALAATVLGVACTMGQDADDVIEPTMSVNDLMLTIVTPATNTLWGIEDPQTDADWQVFIDAADATIDAARTIKVGGTGPNDNAWAEDPVWQAFADQLIAAGEAAPQAAVDQDIEAMYTAGEVLYPPCEECHLKFHPGVAGQP